MIYAKIVDEKPTGAGNTRILIHFYGGPKAEEHTRQIRVKKGHPFDYLASQDFKPISDTLFYQD